MTIAAQSVGVFRGTAEDVDGLSADAGLMRDFGLCRCCAVIWDALKATCEAPDPETARLIVDSAGIIVGKPDMTVCYDERGVPLLYTWKPNICYKTDKILRQQELPQKAGAQAWTI
jgi:hypothetical protein